MSTSPGDRVRISRQGDIIEGILLPNPEDEAYLVVKLDNGYNIGIEAAKVEVKLLTKTPERPHPEEAARQTKGLPSIAILHTGGTIASQVDYETGGVTPRFTPQDILNKFPELRELANIDSWLISAMWSEDMRFEHYKIMAREVKRCVDKGYSGVVITHGTDTMAYSAAALSFILEDVPIPVILVGAQRSSDRGSTDAAMNLICAFEFITKTDFCGVAICMHQSMADDTCIILPPCKTRKMHSSRRDAFKPINQKPIARIHYGSRKIEFLSDYAKRGSARKLMLKDKFEEKVGLLKAHPNMSPQEFGFYKGYKALVIEAYALGHVPIDAPNDAALPNLENAKALAELIASGCAVVITSQCIYGRVHSHVYSKGIELKKMGAIYADDLLTETAFIKLAWLFGNYGREDAIKLITQNLRGEFNPRLLPEEF